VSRKKISRQKSARASQGKPRPRITIAVALALSLVAGGAVLARLRGAAKQLENKTAQVTPASLTPSIPSKEFIYGGRLIATEEPVSACTVSISPTSASFPATSTTGGVQTGVVSVTANCNWTATSNASFISINSGSGSGNGAVSYTVANNTNTTIRNGTITVGTGGPVFTVFQGIGFFDVPTSHSFYTFIGKLSGRGVTAGCGTGCNTSGMPCFCPDGVVTREQMAIFILAAKGVAPPPPTQQTFADVPPERGSYRFVEEINRLGIIQGCGGGNFCPGATITREEMAMFIVKGLGVFSPAMPGQQSFFDVPQSRWSFPWVEEFFRRGITAGCGTGCNTSGIPCYCPDGLITRGQMAVFLVRSFNL
jgi:S-layer family protein/BACON domain-containing protein